MPKLLHEIKNFTSGTITTPSDADIPEDAAVDSLNIDPSAEDGKLKSIPTDSTHLSNVDADKIVLINDEETYRAVYYDKDDGNEIKAINDFHGTPVKDDTLSSGETNSNNECAMQVNNREVHIGMGYGATDKPLWCGIIPFEQFGGGVPSGLQLEDAELAPPSSFPYMHKVVNDGTYIYGIKLNGQYVYKFNISDGSFVSRSVKTFESTRGICIKSGGGLWVYDSGVGVTGTLYSCESTYMQIDGSYVLAGGDLNISDILEVGSYLWFIRTGAFQGASQLMIWNAPTPSSGTVVALTNRTPHFGRTGLSSSTSVGDFVPLGYKDADGMNVGIEAVFTIDTTALAYIDNAGVSDTDYVGVVCRVRDAAGDGINCEMIDSTGPRTSVELNYVFLKIKYNTAANSLMDGTGNNAFLLRLDGTADYSDVLGLETDTGHTSERLFLSYNTLGKTTASIRVFPQPTTGAANAANITGNVTLAATPVPDARVTSKYNSANTRWDLYLFSGSGNGKWYANWITTAYATGTASSKLESRVHLTLTESATSNTNFTNGSNYFYKTSFTYDGYQESPLSIDTYILSTGKSINVAIKVITDSLSQRISHINIYRAEGESGATTPTGYYRLVGSYQLDTAFINNSGTSPFSDYRSRTIYDEGKSSASYEAITGISEAVETFNVRYALSTQINNQHIVGKCDHDEIDNASNYLFKSKPYKYDQFNWVEDILRLNTMPTALASYAGRVYAFDHQRIYRIEPNNFYIEDIFDGVGCAGPDAVLVTEYGMCIADRNGVYLHDGRKPVLISEPIRTGGSVGYQDLLDVDTFAPKVAFDGLRKSFIVFVTASKAWVFNLQRNRWDLWDTNEAKSILHGIDNYVYISDGSNLIKYLGGASNRSWNWKSKKITMGEDSQKKIFKKIRVMGEATDILSTITVDGSSPNDTFSADGSIGGVYTLDSTTNPRKGKYLQLTFTNVAGTKEVDAIGTIYRKSRSPR